MSFDHHGEIVLRRRGALKLSPYSEATYDVDWRTVVEVTITGCAFDPGASAEPVEVDRESVVSSPTLMVPTGADVLPRDRVVVRGVEYDIVGEPADWRSPFTGWRPAFVVKLERVDG